VRAVCPVVEVSFDVRMTGLAGIEKVVDWPYGVFGLIT